MPSPWERAALRRLPDRHLLCYNAAVVTFPGIRDRNRPAFALPFVLLLTVVLSILTSAATYRYIHTTRFLSYGRDTVRARNLADSGIEMALILMRDQDVYWYQDKTLFPGQITSQSLGLTPAAIGGEFELHFEKYPNLYPSRGTFMSVRCVGHAGRAQATSVATVKLTSVLTNFLFLSNGNYTQSSWADSSTSGPIFVNGNGDAGDFRIWHDNRHYQNQTHEIVHAGLTLTMEGQVKAAGQVFIQNVDTVSGNSAAPMQLNGEQSAGTLVHNDLAGAGATGKVVFPDTFMANPNVELNVDIPKVGKLLEKARGIGAVTVDISSYGDGVLAEFTDSGKLVISKVEKKTLGYLYDKDLYDRYQGNLLDLQLGDHGSTDNAAALSRIRSEVTWNDPDIPDAPYPADLQTDLDGDGVVETSGDRLEFKKIVRGAQIASFDIDTSVRTNVQLVTSNTSYDHGFGPEGPAVFVRGIVTGRVGLSYDVTNDSLDPGYDRLHMNILSEHEAPSDSTKKIMTSGPGVPGGLRYSNPAIVKGPEDTNFGSSDKLILLSRGTISASGMNTGFKEKTRDAAGNQTNMASDILSLEQDYVNFYASKYPESSFRQAGQKGTSSAHLQGVFVASEINFRTGRLNNEGYLVPQVSSTSSVRENPTYWKRLNWSLFSGSKPAGAEDDYINTVGLRMRNAAVPSWSRDYLRGIYDSLSRKMVTITGDRQYNYQWQDVDPADLYSEGLPVSVVLCSWQRL